MLGNLFKSKHVVQFIGKANFCSKPNNDFVPVYFFPFIKTFSIVNRIKYYQSAATAGGIPLSVILNQASVITLDQTIATVFVGISGCMVLHTFGLMTKNFVGIMYINEKSDEVKISRLDFWGKRKDDIVPISDIVPFSELPSSITDTLYTKLRFFSDTKTMLKVSLKFGKILDEKLFNKHINQ
ncbi:PREDICTED: transmembrane protein 186 [Nicrophorus vespilloides]|uniref:Transmembrane protein 186 n=1 Tax=Nicrophorus vespilloides TaxID=110193 RepID=A0ABM1NJ94_NICVS|nr:PREDICTED: transmembrane protein 186 [Nicrophorus vespilloides]